VNGLYSVSEAVCSANAEHPMAKVEYADAIKTVSGALTKINKKSPHAADQKMVLATHRVAPTQTEGACSRLYLRGLSAVSRTTPVTAKEIAIRERFIAVQAAVNTRANSLEHVTSDQAAFLAQKDTATGKKTMRAYLWYICGQLYDQEHPRS
jgi:hypothetical protein